MIRKSLNYGDSFVSKNQTSLILSTSICVVLSSKFDVLATKNKNKENNVLNLLKMTMM